MKTGNKYLQRTRLIAIMLCACNLATAQIVEPISIEPYTNIFKAGNKKQIIVNISTGRSGELMFKTDKSRITLIQDKKSNSDSSEFVLNKGSVEQVSEGSYLFTNVEGTVRLPQDISILSIESIGASSVRLELDSGFNIGQELDVTVSHGSLFTARSTDTIERFFAKAYNWGVISAEEMPVRAADITTNSLGLINVNAQVIYIPENRFITTNVSNKNEAGVLKYMRLKDDIFAKEKISTNSKEPTADTLRNTTVTSTVSTTNTDNTAEYTIEPIYVEEIRENNTYINTYYPNYENKEIIDTLDKYIPAKGGYYIEDLAGEYLKGILPSSWLKKRFRGQWMGIEFGFNYYSTPQSGLSTNWPENNNGYENLQLNYSKSGSFAWNVFQISVGFNSPHWGLVTGMGFEWNNYRFDNLNTVPNKENGNVSFNKYEGNDRAYTKSKMSVSYFRIPILFEYNNAKGAFRSFHASVGVIPSVKMISWTKQKYVDEQGMKHKRKEKGDFYINPFKLDLIAYVGWGPLSVYFSYAPTHLFLHNKGVNLTPFGFGLLIGCH